MRKMRDQLTAAIRQIHGCTDNITIGSSEIAGGNTDLSARTEEQAASLEETASSMTELTETVKQNADNARQANALATRTSEMADAGNDAVQGMVQTIGQISGSSNKISEITGVIEGIAFQTNILALNAAVEAARAGEQGRGFAVVASEVRSLAQRSAGAAKEIKELIGSSVAIIQSGAQQAADVGMTMDEVKRAIKQVSDIVGEIAAASEEQSRGIEQVNQAIMQMDAVTQQNASLVEEAAAAAQSLEEQAGGLKNAVAVFKIDNPGHGVSRAAMQ
jgi:methyl-accepting chemotaxis protein